MKKLITRADDMGSCHAANAAIARAVKAGFIKNVSVMSVCRHLQEAADLVANNKDVCFGLHITYNAEWDNVTWGPISESPSLVDERGVCYQSTELFLEHPPKMQELIAEAEAQLQRMKKAGFTVTYAECHMLPERHIPGLQEALQGWMQQHGLLDFSCYMQNILPKMDEVAKDNNLFEQVLQAIKDDEQYVYVAHPADNTPEMLLTGNAQFPAQLIAAHRGQDAQFVADKATLKICARNHAVPIRLDEAQAGQCRIFTPGSIL